MNAADAMQSREKAKRSSDAMLPRANEAAEGSGDASAQESALQETAKADSSATGEEARDDLMAGEVQFEIYNENNVDLDPQQIQQIVNEFQATTRRGGVGNSLLFIIFILYFSS